MSPLLLVSVLTALAAVVVVLTRLRLAGVAGARGDRRALAVHTVVGGLAVLVWAVFLVLGDRVSELTAAVVGIVGVGLWWVTALAGLVILVRWLPSKGRHSGGGAADSWSRGPALSVLAHLGMLLGVGVFTWAYLTAAV